jgi:hypothetical protein
MIEKNRDISIQDNFLAEKEFVALRDIFIDSEPLSPTLHTIQWLYSSLMVNDIDEEPSTSPGHFFHIVYNNNVPCSSIYESHFHPILEALNVHTLIRIKANLNPRLTEPFYSNFHTDVKSLMEEFTTSIFYINTNNGYTEFEDGTIVKSVANRLATFPSNIRHRGVTQTDEQTRILINFNYFAAQGD